MEITTKYNVGNNVCTLHNNRIVYGTIINIKIEVDYKSNINIKYRIQNTTYIEEGTYFKEHTVFKTQAELLEALRKNDSL